MDSILGHSIRIVIDMNECFKPICILSNNFRGCSEKFVDLDRPRLYREKPVGV